jgi:uncharacterized protein
MKIWFDAALPSQYAGEDCDCSDCDCGVASDHAALFASAPTEEDLYRLRTHTLACAETLHVQAFTDGLRLVCNPTGSGEIAIVDAEAYALLEHFRAPRMLRDVVEDGFGHCSNANKAIALFIGLGFLRDLDQPELVPRPGTEQTLSAWLHITNACNLRCHYCYVSKSADHMADDTARRSVDAILRSATSYRYRRIALRYAGGESTLRLPQIFATHDYALEQAQAHGLTLSASVLSNGVVVPRWAIEQLKQRHIGVMISLDGLGEYHDQQRPLINGKGSFLFVDRTITRLLANDLVPFINVTVTQRNLDELPRLMEYLLQRELPFRLSYYRDNECSTDLPDLQFSEMQMINGMRAAFAAIEQRLPRRSVFRSLIDKANIQTPHQHTCGAGQSYLVIDQLGGIAKCPAAITRTVTTIDADNPLRLIREDRRGLQAVTVDEKEGCRTCEWRYWCAGGCPLLTYRLTGRNDIKSPNCAIYKALFPDALRLEALRLLKYEAPIML